MTEKNIICGNESLKMKIPNRFSSLLHCYRSCFFQASAELNYTRRAVWSPFVFYSILFFGCLMSPAFSENDLSFIFGRTISLKRPNSCEWQVKLNIETKVKFLFDLLSSQIDALIVIGFSRRLQCHCEIVSSLNQSTENVLPTGLIKD